MANTDVLHFKKSEFSFRREAFLRSIRSFALGEEGAKKRASRSQGAGHLNLGVPERTRQSSPAGPSREAAVLGDKGAVTSTRRG